MKKENSRDQVEAKINSLAAKDKDFKKRLMDHPHKTLEQMGMQIPSSIKIHVRNEEPGTWELVIRAPQPNTSGMSEEDFKKAGGALDSWACCSLTV